MNRLLRSSLVGAARWWLAVVIGLCGVSAPSVSAQDGALAEVEIRSVLDAFHEAAAAGDWQRYFGLMSSDAVFIGTDAGERWPRDEFQRYASGRSGWTYYPRERHVDLSPDGNTAWFDEILDSVSYGTSRGTGVLVKSGDGWKIAQYHLTFPIPNALARDITDQIKAFAEQ